MHSQSQARFPSCRPNRTESTPTRPREPSVSGFVSEVVYFEDQSIVAHILLPLLRQLGLQARWLLWLTSGRKLNRSWLKQAGLPLEKMMQLHRPSGDEGVAAMEKALLTGNYSVILGWFPKELTAEDKRRLYEAAALGESYGFIIYPQNGASRSSGQFSGIKIHSGWYH
ncbi:SOS-induced cell division inhibitor SulA [Martelella alba]|uniref:Cell division inhibitor SulA n=1 Tax=Martelella alba TaxID=2590451 RepID=A0ABY2SNM2_9HYPH|nr:SOS-induced cell division inhibitor SulA [Martelella alba]TKI07524.1 cell division inhibitor SulA [Martelella alba]